jgi:hypothetical protein
LSDTQRPRTRHWTAPARDLLAGLDLALAGRAAALLAVFAGLAVGWWLYVPTHELLHVAGCVATGGTVERLDLDPMYGASLLRRIFPFVHPGSEYAGRLSGFDTRGSDWIYLATDLAPFVLALFPGYWALRRAARRGSGFLFGASLPFAFSPWLSLTGDAYEIGSLAAVQLPRWEPLRGLLLGDDVFLRYRALAEVAGPAPWGGFALAIAVGVAWALATSALASWLATRLGEPPLEMAPARRAVPDSRRSEDAA